MLTYKDIQDHVLRYLDQAGEDGHGLDVVKDAIRIASTKRVTEDRWTFMLWPNVARVNFTAGQKVYQLHHEALMLTDFWNVTANMIMAETPSRSRYREGVQDDRLHFEFVAPSPVRLQPVEGLVTVTGEAKIRYIDSNDDIQEETLTNAPTSFDVVEILKVTKMNANTLTLIDENSVNILSLTSDTYGKTYPQIRLFGDGVGGEVGEYRFYKVPTLMVDDNDIPDIPYPFSHILVYDALLELATYNDSVPQPYWMQQQEILDRQMRTAYQEGEMEGSEMRQIQEVELYTG